MSWICLTTTTTIATVPKTPLEAEHIFQTFRHTPKVQGANMGNCARKANTGELWFPQICGHKQGIANSLETARGGKKKVPCFFIIHESTEKLCTEKVSDPLTGLSKRAIDFSRKRNFAHFKRRLNRWQFQNEDQSIVGGAVLCIFPQKMRRAFSTNRPSQIQAPKKE